MNIPSFREHYHALNTIEISRSALIYNFTYLSSLEKDISIAPVLKSNAYGHGVQLVAQVLDTAGAPFFCVDSLYEAYELLKIHIKTPILIMGYTHPDNLKVKKLPFSFAVYDKATLEVLQKYQPQVGIHLFIDSGMHREGIRIDELGDFLQFATQFKNINIEGLMSHFGSSDKYNDKSTKQQVEEFAKAQKMLNAHGFNPKWIHIGNSSAILNSKEYKGKIGNLVRTGIDLFGIDPEGKDGKLKPSLKVTTTLCQVKRIDRGEKVGYDFTYIAKNPMKIGILPYGYYDGLDRRLSNKGFVLIDGVKCSILGRVSMNITTVDISKVKNPYVGQKVVVYSENPSDVNSLYHAAITADTIPYDLLVGLAESTRRIVVT